MDSTFLRKTLTLGSGIAISQGLLFLATPLLTRLYSPADFGMFGLLVALASILAVGSNGRYFLAIVQPSDMDEASGLLGLSLSLTLAFGLAIALLLALVHEPFAALMNNPSLISWWWWIPVATVMAGWFDTLNYWHIRNERWGIVSKIQPFRALVLILGQAGSGLAGLGFPGLALGRLLADTVLVGGLLPGLRNDLSRLTAWRQPKRWPALARQFRDFPLFSAPQGWLSALSQYLPVLVLAWLLNDVIVGVYLMTHRILATPNMFIGKALRQVFYQQLHEKSCTPETERDLWYQTTRSLAIWGAIPVLVIFLVAPKLFPLALGDEWIQAGVFARPIVLWQYLAMIAIPSQMVLMAHGLQRWHLKVEIVFLILRFVGLWLGFLLGGAVGSILGFSSAGVLMQATLVFLTIPVAGRKRNGVDNA